MSGQQPFKGWLSVGFRLMSEAVALGWHVAFGCCGGRAGCAVVLRPLVDEAAVADSDGGASLGCRILRVKTKTAKHTTRTLSWAVTGVLGSAFKSIGPDFHHPFSFVLIFTCCHCYKSSPFLHPSNLPTLFTEGGAG